MNIFKISFQVILLYGIYLIGVFIQNVSQIPVPGSIIGMLFLFTALHFKFIKRKWFSLGGAFLLKHLPLLFIPATVGVIDYLELFKGKGLLTIAIAFISTFIVMAASSLISDFILTKGEEKKKDRGLSV
ncbi:CidA/LrgA family protein [Metabacillus litoralis]|uniref:CidA/LrgA family protein n=1 Tax=Metabacillus litoralis TaxID=152268 RepID=A0A5C6VYX3_9BACI|nr:CidA/LrgA family protein [Metabacillus litoralis]TXC90265.1 CidA/LrgA family protein [Metabacillus litoralis]